jgi:hypothetical protein
MATDTAIPPPRPLPYQNRDGDYLNLRGTALNPVDFEKLASRGTSRGLTNERIHAAPRNAGGTSI